MRYFVQFNVINAILVKDSNRFFFAMWQLVPKVRNDHEMKWPCALDSWPFEPKINRLRRLPLCQVSSHSDHGLSFYRANIHPTYTHTSWQSDNNIGAVLCRWRRWWWWWW